MLTINVILIKMGKKLLIYNVQNKLKIILLREH